MPKHVKSFISASVPLVFIILAHLIDLALMQIADASNTTLTVLPYRPATMAVIGLFALGTVAYVWFLAVMPTAQTWSGVSGLVIASLVLLYPYILLLVPDKPYPSLPTFWKMFLSLVVFGSPRSYLFIATHIILVGSVFALVRYFSVRRKEQGEER
jgi:hypothetical protein